MPGDPSQDQDFLQAHPGDQHAYLMQTDPDYAKAAPQDQTAYLNHVWSSNPPTAPGSAPAGQPRAVNPIVTTGMEGTRPTPAIRQHQAEQLDSASPYVIGAASAAVPFAEAGGLVPGALKLGSSLAGTVIGKKAGEWAGGELGGDTGKDIGGTVGGLTGGAVGYGSSSLLPTALGKFIGPENVPLRLQSPQAIGKMVSGARDEMYNDLGERAMTPVKPPPTEPPVTPQGPTRINPPEPPPKVVDPVKEAIGKGIASKVPTRMPTSSDPEVTPLSEGPTAPQHAAVRSGQGSALREFYRSKVPVSDSPNNPPIGKAITEKPKLILTPEEVRAQEQMARAKEAQTQDMKPEARRRGMGYAAGKKSNQL